MLNIFAFITLFFSATSFAAPPSCMNGGFSNIVHHYVDAHTKISFYVAVVDRYTHALECEDGVDKFQQVSPASSIKILVALATLKKIEDRQTYYKGQPLTLNTVVPITAKSPDNRDAGGPPVTKEATIGELLKQMITVSSNTATDVLIDVVGGKDRAYFNKVAKEMGVLHFNLTHKVWEGADSNNPDIGNSFDKTRNLATAVGYGTLYRQIALGTPYLSDQSLNFLRLQLKNQTFQDTWTRDPCFHNQVATYHKVGETTTSSSDAGYYVEPTDHNKIVIFAGIQGADDLKALGDIGREVLVRTGGQNLCSSELKIKSSTPVTGAPSTGIRAGSANP